MDELRLIGRCIAVKIVSPRPRTSLTRGEFRGVSWDKREWKAIIKRRGSRFVRAELIPRSRDDNGQCISILFSDDTSGITMSAGVCKFLLVFDPTVEIFLDIPRDAQLNDSITFEELDPPVTISPY